MDKVLLNDQLVLMHNLLCRMDYNERQGSWILTGKITANEYEALRAASHLLRIEANKPEEGE